MGYGYTQRTKPRLRVLRGYPGQAPSNLSHVAPVATGVTIYSGQLIALEAGEWVLYDSASHAAQTPYIAYHDSSDGDAKEAGLLGYSLEGNFEFETGYFASGLVADNDTPLMGGTGGDAGSLIVASTPATDPIIGFATRAVTGDAVRDLAGQNSEATDTEVVSFVSKVTRVFA